MLRYISCNSVVSKITTPLLILSAHDDPVTRSEFIPIADLRQLPNVLIAIYDKGGHCDFFYKKLSRKTGKYYHKEFMP